MVRYHRCGMTLVELMAVVAIIVMLGSIMAYFITGSRSSNAQNNMTNDILGLINEQRSRAMGLNLAAYIRINQTSVQPLLGDSSACNLDVTGQIPIHYTDGEADSGRNVVAIDFGNVDSRRTLDSQNSDKYYRNEDSLVNVTTSIIDTSGNVKSASSPFTVCFQPNGLVYFISGASFLDEARFARILVERMSDSPGTQYLEISSLGAISRGTLK